MKDSVMDLKKWILFLESVVEEAFYKVYAKNDSNWVNLEKINIENYLSDNPSDVPFVSLKVSYKTTTSEETENIEMAYYLDESPEYNVGRLSYQFEVEGD